MSKLFQEEIHYIGTFDILSEIITGEIIHNENNGVIILNLAKKLSSNELFGKSYGKIPIIYGQINNGAKVTLFENKCINNHSRFGSTQTLCFKTEYFIWSSKTQISQKYNELVCVLKNAFEWCQMPVFETSNNCLKRINNNNTNEFHWYGANIKFRTFSNEHFLFPFDEEEHIITQQVQLFIKCESQKSISELIKIRNNVLSMISFAIKNNINIIDQYLINYEDKYTLANDVSEYTKHYLIESRRDLENYKTNIWDYNFRLNDIPKDKDINHCLEKLIPVFNLYLSLFKYRDMPVEMIFLNIVQALETLHSRFYYDNKKNNYLKSVNDRFPDIMSDEEIKPLLLSDTQVNKSSNIILFSRLNDLLIGKNDGLFYDYWTESSDFSQSVVDTRHYFTHYSVSKEQKALKGDELDDAIFVLKTLLEHNVCAILGIDISDKVRKKLSNHNLWKKFEDRQNNS